MKRRAFLSLMGAAGVAPALPAMGAPAPVAAGYNRYIYGLAVFHARTRATVSAADLMARLKVNAVQAEAMMGEMTAKGVIAPVVNAATTATRALDPHHGGSSDRLRSVMRRAADWLNDNEAPAETRAEDELNSADDAQESQDGQV